MVSPAHVCYIGGSLDKQIVFDVLPRIDPVSPRVAPHFPLHTPLQNGGKAPGSQSYGHAPRILFFPSFAWNAALYLYETEIRCLPDATASPSTGC